MTTSLSVRLTSTPSDGWDDFVASRPGDTFAQSTLYAMVKQTFRSGYCELWRGSQLIAGAQLLSRPVGRVGAVGYVANGPVITDHSSSVADRLVEAMLTLARRDRVRAMVVQPAEQIAVLDTALHRHGFRPSPVDVATVCAIAVDLRQSEEELLARMRAGLRRNIRKAERAGVIVVTADRSRLSEFHGMHVETAKRNGFVPQPLERMLTEWDVLHPRGLMELFVAEHEGVPLSAATVTIFGDRVLFRHGGWFRSREVESYRPNDILHWRIMQWAKSSGYATYDFGGFDGGAAAALASGEPLPESFRKSYSHFKLGYGGDPIILPHAVWRVIPAALRPMQPVADWSLRSMPRVREAIERRQRGE